MRSCWSSTTSLGTRAFISYPSTAYAGGLPDIMCYAMAKEARGKHDEQLKEFHGYVSMYQEREGTVGASGGTLSTRAGDGAGRRRVRKVDDRPLRARWFC